MSSGDHRILGFLKFRGPQTTSAIARHLKITLPGARKHLLMLTEAGLVAFADEKAGVGRPRRRWRLTERSASRFPDTHAFVTIEMIDAVRESFGESGLETIIAHREEHTEKRYRSALAGCRDLPTRLARLAALRSEEGYMADWQALSDGTYLLCENHCPICAAARHCQGFCRSELAVFRQLLGGQASVEREEHILSGARRCAYRITPLRVGAS
jgi:predicted ArsR family transcriptional regulator